MNKPITEKAIYIEVLAKDLVLEAIKHGMVVTITVKPLEPLAMGHNKMVVDVYPARELATRSVKLDPALVGTCGYPHNTQFENRTQEACRHMWNPLTMSCFECGKSQNA